MASDFELAVPRPPDDLFAPSELVARRDKANGAVKTYAVVMVHKVDDKFSCFVE